MSESTSPSPLARCWQWLTGDAAVELPDPGLGAANHEPIDWRRAVPFAALHLGCLLVLVTGVSWTAVAVCLGLYIARMFFVTGFYHRYFAHRGFQTSRAFQFVMGALGCTAGQRGPLWWAAQHRHHHNHSDGEKDHHSPRQLGFWRAHLGWFLTRTGFTTDRSYVGDWARYPELRWLNRLDWVPLLLLGGGLYLLGAFLNQTWPGLNTSGLQLLAWGFFVSTILCYHATYTINSLAHCIGTRRFKTDDDSRNNWWLALLTLGEGWHNNHHHYPASARQGFYWWEIDLTWWGLRALAAVGLVHDLRPVPEHVLRRNRIDAPSEDDA